jgi:O-antigen ligase
LLKDNLLFSKVTNLNIKIDLLLSLLLMSLAFSIAVSVALTNIILALMFILFLYERKYSDRLAKIKNNPLTYIVLALVGMHIVGTFWTDDLVAASSTIKQVKKFLYIPFLMMFVKREHILYYLQAFIFGMMVSETLTYLVWFKIIPPFMYADATFPSPLIRYNKYTVFVAMAAILILYMFITGRFKTNTQKIINGLFFTTMAINLFISGGRAGQLGFLIALFVLILYVYKGKILRGIGIFIIATSLIFSLAYTTSSLFKARVDQGISDITSYKEGEQKTSLGIRFAYYHNYYQVFKEKPIFGWGTAGYNNAYNKVNAVSPYKAEGSNPHNMYLLFMIQFGLVGLFIFLWLFVYQIYYAFKIKDQYQVLRIAIPLLFVSVNMFYWYLYAFHTLLLYVVLTTILYTKDNETMYLGKE